MMKNKFQIIVWVAIIIFVTFFSYLSIKRYRTLNSYYYDLGIMNQVVYNTSRGRILEMTNQDLKKNISRFAIHFDPILAAFAPFYWIYPGPEVLLIGQAIILGLGAWAVFLIAEKVLKKNLISVIFSFCYLFYFAVQRTVLFDFHAVTLSTTFFLFALYFDLAKKKVFYFLFIVLSLLTKEHVGLIVFMLGLYQMIFRKEKKTGFITLLLGLVFFVSTVYFIIPSFRGGEHFASGYFENIGLRLKSIIVDGINYTKLLLLPNIYSLFSPHTLLIALPEWAINVLSSNNNMISYYFHYHSVIVAFLFYSLILGYRNFDRLVKNKTVKTAVFILFLLLNFWSIYQYNPVPSVVKRPVNYQELDPTTKKSIEEWREKLKDENISLSTTPKLAPFFTNRIYYHNFLYDSAYSEMGLVDDDIMETVDDYRTADYVIVYRLEIGDIGNETLPVKFYGKLREDKDFEMIYSDDRDEKSLEVYKKI